jgi:hypothetical protein
VDEVAPRRQLWFLRVVLALAIVESFVHYADNTLRYDDYTVADPTFPGGLVQQWVIPVAWVLFTVAGLVSYRRFRDGRRPEAAAWLGVYSVSGLISVLHYTDISVDDLSGFQNTFVFLDVVLGAVVLGFALWIAWHPVPATPDEVSRLRPPSVASRPPGRASRTPVD